MPRKNQTRVYPCEHHLSNKENTVSNSQSLAQKTCRARDNPRKWQASSKSQKKIVEDHQTTIKFKDRQIYSLSAQLRVLSTTTELLQHQIKELKCENKKLIKQAQMLREEEKNGETLKDENKRLKGDLLTYQQIFVKLGELQEMQEKLLEENQKYRKTNQLQKVILCNIKKLHSTENSTFSKKKHVSMIDHYNRYMQEDIRRERIQSQLDRLYSHPNFEVELCEPDDLTRKDFWVVWIVGRKNTLWEGGIYPFCVSFPKNYPAKPPEVEFQNEFLHVHVYEGGAVCMPFIEQQYWQPKSTLTEILLRIEAVLHQDINEHSPANTTFYKLYKTNQKTYEEQVKKQAEAYHQKKAKYFMKPSVHITVRRSDN